jgi:exonuclease III
VVLVYWSIKGWHQLKCISTSEHFVAVSINGMLIINVYFPKLVDPVKYGDDMLSLFAVIRLVINDNRKQRLLIGGDFNFEFNKSQPGCICIS